MPARSPQASARATKLRAHTGLLAVEELEHAVGPRQDRPRALEPVQKGQVGEEILVAVDPALDLLELGQLHSSEPLALGDLVAESAEVAVAPEEELQEQPVAGDAGDRLGRLEPAAQRLLARTRDRVELLVRPLVLRDRRGPRESALDKPREDRVDLALRRAPEVADAAARELVELVAGPLAEREQAEDGVLGVGKAGRHSPQGTNPRGSGQAARQPSKGFRLPADPSFEGCLRFATFCSSS